MPGPLYALLPYPVDYVPYTASHVVLQLQLLLFSGLAFFLMLAWLKRTLTITLDVDWLWRRPGPDHARPRRRACSTQCGRAWPVPPVRSSIRRVSRDRPQRSGPQGVLGGTRPIRSMALWVLVVLLAYLLFYFAG